MALPLRFTRAICRGIPRSLVAEAQRMDCNGPPVDYEKALKQHGLYVEALKRLHIDVTVLEADENLPDCVFVEDTAIVSGDIALLTRTGHESRRKEITAMKDCLVSKGYEPIEMTEPGKLDGGDVLFTGHEFFVGLSKRSNEEGIEQLKKAFQNYPIYAIEVERALHLKSIITMAGEDVMVIADGFEKVQKIIKQNAKVDYKFLIVPDQQAANCVYANGALIVCSRDEFPLSAGVYDQLNRIKIDVETSEIAKVDGGLTCLSILLK